MLEEDQRTGLSTKKHSMLPNSFKTAKRKIFDFTVHQKYLKERYLDTLGHQKPKR